ncbi:hypothetical protein QWY99_22030 [Flavobacterium branchiarum]|uniref:Four helix bundle protein n=1 Tax=Flavobacterium branchiarum TaxID=1114870 RepID=A0ABV5FJ34_9FLAO|nr:hypothetical protein [Flavobacterium branchiarum]MDN3675716.1 hypothetical protein [Flavobacterium branchiarum]
MKIDLKLNPETALIVAATIEAVYNSKALTRREKSILSIALDLATKLDGKAVHIKAKRNQFNAKKKITVSLKFHEADMLELLLLQQIKGIHDSYIRLEIQKAINLLNQKLA